MWSPRDALRLHVHLRAPLHARMHGLTPEQAAQGALRYALRHAELGYRQTPVVLHRRADGLKRADFLRVEWRGENSGTLDPEVLRDWSVQHGCSFAILCGPSGLDVPDLDRKDGGPQVWAELGMPSSKHVVDTPGGGVHHYWRRVGEGIGTNAGKVAPGVDARSVGGVVFAPGSFVLDVDGQVEERTYVGELPPVGELEPTPDVVVKLWAEHQAVERASDGRTVVQEESWVIERCTEQRQRVRAFDPRTQGGFRPLIMGAAMVLGRAADAGISTMERARDALLADVASVWGQPDSDDREWIRRGLVDGPAKERWRLHARVDPFSVGTSIGASDTASDLATNSWQPRDLHAALTARRAPVEPSVGALRDDGVRVLYPGKEHAAIGEMEAGKSWWALQHCAAELMAGNRVVYVHFEEQDEEETVSRLHRRFLVPAERILADFLFVAPERAITAADVEALCAEKAPTLVVLDGVNEGMALHGQKIREEDGAAAFRRRVVRPFKAYGAALLSLDHVVKDKDARREGYALGTIHKGNGLDGALFLLENMEPFGEGRKGVTNVYVTKDRKGKLRKLGRPADGAGAARRFYIGQLRLDDSGDAWSVKFTAPRAADDGEDPAWAADRERRAAGQIDQKVYAIAAEAIRKAERERRDPPSKTAIVSITGMNRNVVFAALDRLVDCNQLHNSAFAGRSALTFPDDRDPEKQ